MMKLNARGLLISGCLVGTMLAPLPVFGAPMSPWATAPGGAPAHFQNHGLAHDHASGPNRTHAVGYWSGSHRHASYSGFELPVQAMVPTVVRVRLAGYLSAPIRANVVDVRLRNGNSTYGPLTLGPAQLNQHVGIDQAGVWTLEFSSFYDFPHASLQGPVEVDIRLTRFAPADDVAFHLDAVGLDVDMTDANAVFDLWAGDDASTLDSQAPVLLDVSSPLDVNASSCPGNICFMRIRDLSGQARQLSVVPLADSTTVRVGFSDGHEDAPVDATLSQVAVDGEAVADSVTAVQVLVTPRDASGHLLGGGLALRLDARALGLAEVLSPFRHLENGTYALELVSASAGEARIIVQVDGVALEQAPTVLFSAP